MKRAATALALPWVALAGIRSLGLDRGPVLLSAVAFTPYLTAAAVLPLGIAVATRAWPAAALVLASAVVLAAAVLPRALADGGRPPGGGPEVTVMSLNLDDGHADPARIRALVQGRQVAVLAVCELKGALPALRRAVGSQLPFVTVSQYSRGGGSALFSRWRGTAIDRPRITRNPEAPEVRLAEPPLTVAVEHGPHPTSGALAREWERRLSAIPAPGPGLRVELGDLNATLDHDALRRVLARGYRDVAAATGAGLEPTWGALTIDHVLADRRIRPLSFATAAVAGTDHRAVIARLALPKGA